LIMYCDIDNNIKFDTHFPFNIVKWLLFLGVSLGT